MATASTSDPNLECPICHEDFDQPKILPCTHLACKKCVLSWLSAEGSDGGCPICRAPILSSTRPAQGQLATLVDALPTNFAVMALVESQQVLTSPHVCNMCNHVQATSYCLQCDLKLCRNCVKTHNVIPSLKNHVIEDINKLTLDRLAETNRTMCKAHPDRLGELFCSAHKEVICLMCASTKHESCTGKQSIADAADGKRAELKDRACAMRQSEGNLKQQIQDGMDAFKVARTRIDATFDDIQKLVESRRQDLKRELQTKEDAAMTAIKSKDTTRASLASNANTLEQLVSTAPQAALLAMVADLTSRLDQLQSHTATTTAGQLQVPEFTVDDSTLRQLKSDISSLGHITVTSQTATKPKSSQTASPQSTSSQRTSSQTASLQSTSSQRTSSKTSSSQPTSSQNVRVTASSSQPGPKPRGAELARVLKVGDRVKLAPGWDPGLRPDHQGRVTAIPSRLATTRYGMDPNGNVDVRWDGEGEDFCHPMGAGGLYTLELV